jgi:protein-L-isoaspartate(D-aspartate) O-methyltransferase
MSCCCVSVAFIAAFSSASARSYSSDSENLRGAWRTRAGTNEGLIEGLKRNNVLRSKRVEETLRKVDRGNYAGDTHSAYFDEPVPIGYRQTISAPHMHVMALEKLEEFINEGSKVLDVGSGSGFLTACFGVLVGESGKVVGIERLQKVSEFGRDNMERANPELKGRVSFVKGDGWKGYKSEAPFDAIHVGAAAETMPEDLVQQLKNGGRMIIPIGVHEQTLYQVDKAIDGSVSMKPLVDVIYVPLVKGDRVDI